MPLSDFLAPNENVKFESMQRIQSAGKPYQVIVTDKRLILYARRGLLFKSDNVITETLADLHGIKYAEKGIIGKKGILTIQAKDSFHILEGKPAEAKALYQSLLQFIG